jgi:hypothetical protein
MGGLALPAGAVVGARVDVIGTLKAYNNDSQGETLPELQGLQMTVSAAPSGPAIAPVTNQTAATLTVAASGRPYVGSLVKLTLVKVLAPSDPANHNIASLKQGTTMFEAAGDVTTISDAANTCYADVTGIWTYDVYNNAYAIEITALGATGATCP